MTLGLGELKRDRDRFVAFSFAAADLLLEIDGGGVVRSALGAARGLTLRDAQELVGRPLLELIAGDERDAVSDALAALPADGRLPVMPVKLEGSARPALLGGCRIEGEDALYVTLTAARLAFAASAAAAARDAGTGLIAGEEFASVAAECLDSARAVGQAAQLTVLELPSLAELRMQLGEVPYSDLLARIGGLLRGRSLGGDAAGALREGRYALMHARTLSGAQLAHAVERIVDPGGALAVEVRRRSLDLSSSQFSPEDARQALIYTIRRFAETPVGELEIQSLGESLDGLMNETVLRIRSLRETVKRGRFDIAFQPIVELASGWAHHYEVLSRFEGGESPFRVVTFAEEVGVIHDFDLAVCQRAIDLLRERDGHGAVADLSVNLSARSLDSDLFIAALGAILEPLGPGLRRRLLFEITESTSIRDLPRAAKVLDSLRAEGHAICLDDFGAGAASLPYLQALPLDYVKIDGGYVRQVLASQRDAAILKSISRLCRDLQIGCIAEMIESQGQAEKIAKLGVGYGQGYHFGRPRPDLPAPGARALAATRQ